MSETPRNSRNQDQSGTVEPLFADAPPLEGEQLCICGASEGEHLFDGACPDQTDRWLDGAIHFFSADPAEETTSPEIRVEYEPGCEPAGAR